MNNSIQNMLSQQVLNQLGRQLGFSNGIPQQYVELASTMLMGGMSKNVRSPQGAESLYNALKRDHASNSNNVLGNLLNFIPSALNQADGGGILDNVFGQRLDPIVTAFSNATGLPKPKAKQLLMIIAPIVLAYLANKMTQKNLSKEELAREVQQDYREPERSFRTKKDEGLLEQLLDRNNDGSFIDDAAGLLGNLLLK